MNDPEIKQICTRANKLFLQVFLLGLWTEHILKSIKLITLNILRFIGSFVQTVAPRSRQIRTEMIYEKLWRDLGDCLESSRNFLNI